MKSPAMQKLQIDLPYTLDDHASYKADVYVVTPMTHPTSIAHQQASKAPTYSDLPTYLLTYLLHATYYAMFGEKRFDQTMWQIDHMGLQSTTHEDLALTPNACYFHAHRSQLNRTHHEFVFNVALLA
jgi:hypothetical protein